MGIGLRSHASRVVSWAGLLVLTGLARGNEDPTGRNNENFSFRSTGGGVIALDPVATCNGAYFFVLPLLDLGGPMGLRADLLYGTDLPMVTDVGLPQRFWVTPWCAAFHVALPSGVEFAGFQVRDGRTVAFNRVAGQWVLAGAGEGQGYPDNGSPRRYVLQQTAGFFYLVDPVDERVYAFDRVTPSTPRIARIWDRVGNELLFAYTTGTTGPTSIDDGLGRTLTLAYETVGFATVLRTITDQTGRVVTLHYEAAGADNGNSATLRSVEGACGETTTFSYAGGTGPRNRIVATELPAGNTPWTQAYGDAVNLNGRACSRVTSQTPALGSAATLAYDAASNRVTVTDGVGDASVHEHFSHHGLPKTLTDPLGNMVAFAKNDDEQVTSVTSPLGSVTAATYHGASGKLASRTDPLGNAWTMTYGPADQTFTNPANGDEVQVRFHDLLRIDFPDGTHQAYTHDASGRTVSVRDRRGGTTAYAYDARGNVLTTTNALGGVATHSYFPSAYLASRSDTDTGTTQFLCDATNGRLVLATEPGGFQRAFAYDDNDHLVGAQDGNGRTTTFRYDVNGRATQLDLPGTRTARFEYDAMNRLTRAVDPEGGATTYGYDAAGRLASCTDPTNVAVSAARDAAGAVVRVTVADSTWRIGWDADGRPVTFASPSGRTATYGYDASGRTTSVVDPGGRVTTYDYDAMDRRTRRVDASGGETTYEYDALGNLVRVVAPGGATAAYERDALGNVTRIVDAGGNAWTVTRTPMGRISGLTDPLGNATRQSYDQRGLPDVTTLPDGSTLRRVHDGAGNLGGLLHDGVPAGPSVTFAYGPGDQVTATSGLLLEYDRNGRVTRSENPGTSFGATYDAAGRLRTATYADGAFTVTYSYDAATGVLTGVTDDLTGSTVGFTYDADFRITGIARSNGVATTYDYDAAGRLVRLRDGSFLDQRRTLDALGRVTSASVTAPLDASAGLVSNVDETTTYDAASQISSAGWTYDARGRVTASPGHQFTWDGLSRLLAVDDVTFGYNGFGDLRTRTQGGVTRHWFRNYAIALAPAVAARRAAAAAWLRYYVWTPGGALLYVIDASAGNAVSFPHFDLVGSTLALTDAAGQVTDAYAYDPFGRLVARQGASAQPFTFAGRWGVQSESAGGDLHHMRARWYDAGSGRFLSRDPDWPVLADPRLLDPYVYAAADPVNHLDPLGGPTFYNTGDITITADISVPNNLALVAMGDVIAPLPPLGIDTSGRGGNGGDIVIVAGASITPTGVGGPLPPGDEYLRRRIELDGDLDDTSPSGADGPGRDILLEGYRSAPPGGRLAPAAAGPGARLASHSGDVDLYRAQPAAGDRSVFLVGSTDLPLELLPAPVGKLTAANSYFPGSSGPAGAAPRKPALAPDPVATPGGGGTRAIVLGQGVLVVQGGAEPANAIGFVVNTHSGPFETSVFGFVPVPGASR